MCPLHVNASDCYTRWIMYSARQLRCSAETSLVRTEELLGINYIVFPIVAMVGDSVIQSLGSDGPELVPKEELLQLPFIFNFKPAVLNHPIVNDEPKSACDPLILPGYLVGTIFKTHVNDNGDLAMEIWLDPNRCFSLGEDGQSLLTRVLSNEIVEVSVGVYVQLEEVEGTMNDQEYIGIWRNIKPDHLALLKKGQTGACGVDIGCGGPRLNKKEDNRMSKPKGSDSKQGNNKQATNSNNSKRSSLNDYDLSRWLRKIIRNIESQNYSEDDGFWLWIEAIDTTENIFVYSIETHSEWVMFRRSFVLNDNKLSVGDDRVEVIAVTTYVEVNDNEISIDDESENNSESELVDNQALITELKDNSVDVKTILARSANSILYETSEGNFYRQKFQTSSGKPNLRSRQLLGDNAMCKCDDDNTVEEVVEESTEIEIESKGANNTATNPKSASLKGASIDMSTNINELVAAAVSQALSNNPQIKTLSKLAEQHADNEAKVKENLATAAKAVVPSLSDDEINSMSLETLQSIANRSSNTGVVDYSGRASYTGNSDVSSPPSSWGLDSEN